MLRQIGRSSEHLPKQIHEDIQFLLSNIRARENGLIFFLQRFGSDCKNYDQFTIHKQQFLQKQKIYSSQVNRIISKFTSDEQCKQQMQQFKRTFWIKVKSIIKVSLDRLRMLKLLNEPIFNRYEEIINMVNKNYDEEKNLEDFSGVQNLLKKRNVDALIYSRMHFDSPGSEGKFAKNRSESVFKHSSKYSPKPNRMGEQSLGNQQLNGIAVLNFHEQNIESTESRMKSLNRYHRKKLLIENKNISSKATQKNYKKINKGIEKFQQSLAGAMDCVVELNIDRKKTIKQNKQAIYDDLFSKNIPNHKLISKFLFGACGIAQLLVKRKNMKAKKIIVSKPSKNNQQSKQTQKKVKIKLIKQVRQKDKDKDKERVKQKIMQKQKQKQKQKNYGKQKSKERPQSSLTAQIRSIFEDERKRMIQTTLILQDKKNSRYRKKIGTRIQKYSKMMKLIS